MSDCTYIVTSEELKRFATNLRICLKVNELGQALNEFCGVLSTAFSEVGEILGKAFSEAADAFDDLLEALAEVDAEIMDKPKPKRPQYKSTHPYSFMVDQRTLIYKIKYKYRKE